MSSRSYMFIYKELLNCLKREDTVTDVSSRFEKWNTDFERVADCYSLLKFYHLLPAFQMPSTRKSVEMSEKFKNDGNKAFVNKNDYLALYFYTRAATYAPNVSKQLSLAYANRSAVTYTLGEYSDCVKDVDRALAGDYPEHLKYKLLERKGKALMKLGNLDAAKLALQVAIECLPQSNLDCQKFKSTRSGLISLVTDCEERPPTDGAEDTRCPPPRQTSSSGGVKDAGVDWELEELTHGPSPHLQSGSAALEIRYSPGMGRHLIATTHIYPGDVLAVEKPFSSISLPSSYFSHCFHCHRRCHSMIPCTECTMVCYCDEKCRESSWENSHSVECAILKPLLQLDCGKMELLALRVLLNATDKGRRLEWLLFSLEDLDSYDEEKKKGFTDDIYKSDEYKAIHNLEGNTDQRGVSYLFNRSVLASCILHLLSEYTEFFENAATEMSTTTNDSLKTPLHKLENKFKLTWEIILTGGLILKYLLSMSSNAHEISEMRFLPGEKGDEVVSAEIGSAAYPLLSLINHSCDPNVVRHSHQGAVVRLTALQIIREGQQIFDNYGYHHAVHTKEERHSHMKSQYHFTCECTACLEDWPLFLDTPSVNPSYLKSSPNLEELTKSSEKYKEILDELSRGRKVSSQTLHSWLVSLYSHLRLLQENIRRPWPEFNGCQEVIKQCLSFLANHYFYKSQPPRSSPSSSGRQQSLIDPDTGSSPF